VFDAQEYLKTMQGETQELIEAVEGVKELYAVWIATSHPFLFPH